MDDIVHHSLGDTGTAADRQLVFSIPLKKLRWTKQAISLPHLWPAKDTVCETGPIVVSQLNDGNWFVHNGRHRAIRALLKGEKRIDAVELY